MSLLNPNLFNRIIHQLLGPGLRVRAGSLFARAPQAGEPKSGFGKKDASPHLRGLARIWSKSFPTA